MKYILIKSQWARACKLIVCYHLLSQYKKVILEYFVVSVLRTVNDHFKCASSIFWLPLTALQPTNYQVSSYFYHRIMVFFLQTET